MIRKEAFRKYVINSKLSVSLRGTWKGDAAWEMLHARVPSCAGIQNAKNVILLKSLGFWLKIKSLVCLSLPQVVASTASKRWVAARPWRWPPRPPRRWCRWSPRPRRARPASPATSSPSAPSKSPSWLRLCQVRSLLVTPVSSFWCLFAMKRGFCAWVSVNIQGIFSSV